VAEHHWKIMNPPVRHQVQLTTTVGATPAIVVWLLGMHQTPQTNTGTSVFQPGTGALASETASPTGKNCTLFEARRRRHARQKK
jgi:hypothetical protein